jgi:hypothetical protein
MRELDWQEQSKMQDKNMQANHDCLPSWIMDTLHTQGRQKLFHRSAMFRRFDLDWLSEVHLDRLARAGISHDGLGEEP